MGKKRQVFHMQMCFYHESQVLLKLHYWFSDLIYFFFCYCLLSCLICKSQPLQPLWSQELVELINSNRVLVVSGETGCGKTTQVTQFILDDHINRGMGSMCRVVCTQPRRISAISVCTLLASEGLYVVVCLLILMWLPWQCFCYAASLWDRSGSHLWFLADLLVLCPRLASLPSNVSL